MCMLCLNKRKLLFLCFKVYDHEIRYAFVQRSRWFFNCSAFPFSLLLDLHYYSFCSQPPGMHGRSSAIQAPAPAVVDPPTTNSKASSRSGRNKLSVRTDRLRGDGQPSSTRTAKSPKRMWRAGYSDGAGEQCNLHCQYCRSLPL